MSGLWQRQWSKVAAGLAVVAVVGGGYAAYAAKTGGPAGYRTATVEEADVAQTVELSGTVAQQGRSDLAFGASGTVAAVKVADGDTVRKGQVLARLDTVVLQSAVTEARASLVSARAQLSTDEAAQIDQTTGESTGGGTSSIEGGGTVGSSPSSSATSPGKGPGGAVPSGGTRPSGGTTTPGEGTTQGGGTEPGGGTSSPGSGGASDTAALVAQVKTAQSAVKLAQEQLDDAQTQLTDSSTGAKAYLGRLGAALEALNGALDDDGDLAQALAAAKTDCGSSAEADACSNDIQAAIDALGGAQGDVPRTGDGSDLANAQQSVDEAATNVATAQGKLATAVADLDKLLASAQSSSGSSTGSASSAADTMPDGSDGGIVTAAYVVSASGSIGTSGTSTGSSSGLSGGGQSVTAATIASDEASIDHATADVIAAEQARAGAVITAPAKGTVAQVSVSRGQSASAGSTAITVVAPGLATVDLSVSSSQIAQLKAGQRAHVTPAGATTALTGSVTSVSNVPDSSSSSTSYPVVVTLTKPDASLLVGTTASVEIVAGEATDALTVPTSAVSNGMVEVLSGDSVQRVRVTTGLVGRTRTVITDGLQTGQQVVLANLSQALPSGDSTQQRGFGGGLRTGGLGGGLGAPGSFGSGRID